jgi:hypothetical protein
MACFALLRDRPKTGVNTVPVIKMRHYEEPVWSAPSLDQPTMFLECLQRSRFPLIPFLRRASSLGIDATSLTTNDREFALTARPDA